MSKPLASKPTWEIRRPNERLEGAFEVGEGEGLDGDVLDQRRRSLWGKKRKLSKDPKCVSSGKLTFLRSPAEPSETLEIRTALLIHQ